MLEHFKKCLLTFALLLLYLCTTTTAEDLPSECDGYHVTQGNPLDEKTNLIVLDRQAKEIESSDIRCAVALMNENKNVQNDAKIDFKNMGIFLNEVLFIEKLSSLLQAAGYQLRDKMFFIHSNHKGFECGLNSLVNRSMPHRLQFVSHKGPYIIIQLTDLDETEQSEKSNQYIEAFKFLYNCGATLFKAKPFKQPAVEVSCEMVFDLGVPVR